MCVFLSSVGKIDPIAVYTKTRSRTIYGIGREGVITIETRIDIHGEGWGGRGNPIKHQTKFYLGGRVGSE